MSATAGANGKANRISEEAESIPTPVTPRRRDRRTKAAAEGAPGGVDPQKLARVARVGVAHIELVVVYTFQNEAGDVLGEQPIKVHERLNLRDPLVRGQVNLGGLIDQQRDHLLRQVLAQQAGQDAAKSALAEVQPES